MGENKRNIEHRIVTTVDDEIFSEFYGENKSKKIHKKVVEFYSRKSPQEIAALNRLWDEMTEEQRRKPNK